MTDFDFFHDHAPDQQRAELEVEARRIYSGDLHMIFHAVEEKESIRVPTNDERRAMWSAKFYNGGHHRSDHPADNKEKKLWESEQSSS